MPRILCTTFVAAARRRTPFSLAARRSRAAWLIAPIVCASRASLAEPPPTTVRLDPIEVVAPAESTPSPPSSPGSRSISASRLDPRRGTTRDTARLLDESPGVSPASAGAISSQPVVRGLADDRVRIEIDGVEPVPACPNHMNSPLSYIDPKKVGTVTVYPGITPVSVGGDSIGGTIQVKSLPPPFAPADRDYLTKGQLGSFYRSNGNAYGYDLSASAALRWLSLSYTESASRADNYTAARAFKPRSELLRDDEVGSSAYRGLRNRAVTFALKKSYHLVQVDLSQQTIGFEGFPNQRMDMTANDNKLVSARYTAKPDWGDLEATLSYQHTEHRMDMGPDRFSYGFGMPMNTRAKTLGAALRAGVFASDNHTLKAGLECQRHVLYDWWPPVGGAMGPNSFWNIDFGRRQKIDSFLEWEAAWTDTLTSVMGIRNDVVTTDAAAVRGYDDSLDGLWGADARAFNARPRRGEDVNWNFASILRFEPSARITLEGGYARKVRSPNLYQRYAWATGAMAALMNNTVGDGNGYVGSTSLRRETANTLSLTGTWRGADPKKWELSATSHATHVADYIDAKRCEFGQCSADNRAATNGFVILQYQNRDAALVGVDLSGRWVLAHSERRGTLEGRALASYLRGWLVSSGEGLYNIMPPNAKVTLAYRLGGWSAASEVTAVAAKTHVSSVRNEVRTGGYGLLALRGAYETKHARFDVAMENVFNAFYSLPLGGAYVGEGASMTTSGIAWGTPVPGPGRSLNVAVSLFF